MARRPVGQRDENGHKWCSSCDDWLPESAFAKGARSSDGLQTWCRQCRADHYQSRREVVRDSMRFHRFGLDRAAFDAKLSGQGGCAICGTPDPGPVFWNVDHDHACCPSERSCGGCVRGILCSRCNHGLGHFADSTERLSAAIDYLNFWREAHAV